MSARARFLDLEPNAQLAGQGKAALDTLDRDFPCAAVVVVAAAVGTAQIYIDKQQAKSMGSQVAGQCAASVRSSLQNAWFDQRDCIQGLNRCRAIAPIPSYSSGLTKHPAQP